MRAISRSTPMPPAASTRWRFPVPACRATGCHKIWSSWGSASIPIPRRRCCTPPRRSRSLVGGDCQRWFDQRDSHVLATGRHQLCGQSHGQLRCHRRRQHAGGFRYRRVEQRGATKSGHPGDQRQSRFLGDAAVRHHADLGAWSGAIASGGSTNVTVTFSPLVATNYAGNLTVNSDATGGVNTLAVSGTGVSSNGVPQNLVILGISVNPDSSATLLYATTPISEPGRGRLPAVVRPT